MSRQSCIVLAQESVVVSFSSPCLQVSSVLCLGWYKREVPFVSPLRQNCHNPTKWQRCCLLWRGSVMGGSTVCFVFRGGGYGLWIFAFAILTSLFSFNWITSAGVITFWMKYCCAIWNNPSDYEIFCLIGKMWNKINPLYASAYFIASAISYAKRISQIPKGIYFVENGPHLS